MQLSRRQFAQVTAAAFPAILSGQKVSGVQLGICTYSFRTLPHTAGGDAVDAVIGAMKECGGTECELFSPQLEPDAPRARPDTPEGKKTRDQLRQWRLDTPAAHFKEVRKKFDDAGITIFAYTMNFREDCTDAELDKCFEQAKALGAKTIATSTTLTMSSRLAPFAEKHKQLVSLHGHSNVKDANEFSSPETFEKALAMSKQFRINLDIGHFTAANFDAVEYVEKQHKNITHLHMKDRKRDGGTNEPFGQGDTPIKQVLTLLKTKRYAIPAFIEYEYKGAGTPVEEVKKCLEYERAALAS